jgi:hypothetical protein
VTGYPRPLTSIHQIEVTSFCNLRCSYCPSKQLPKLRGKPSEHIALETYERALSWAAYFNAAGTQGELSLTGIGETLLHPEWRELVRLARHVLPHNFICFSTNGLLLDDDACAFLAEHRVAVFVSLHRPEKAGPAINAARRHGILADTNVSAATSSFDWAGLLADKWAVTAPATTCEYLRSGWGVVLADGRVTTCCLDATGAGVVGHVDDELGSLALKPWGDDQVGCAACHMEVPALDRDSVGDRPTHPVAA